MLLFAQIRSTKCRPWLDWVTVVFVSIVGALVTDNLTDNFGISLYVTTTVFAVALAVTAAGWYQSQRTLSIHTIVTRKRESIYWVAILLTFALGTAVGDLMEETLQPGYAPATLLFAAMIAAIAIAHLRFGANPILIFRIAYILTLPFGGSLGDTLTKPMTEGGPGVGTVRTSGLFLTAIRGLVTVLSLAANRLTTTPDVAKGWPDRITNPCTHVPNRPDRRCPRGRRQRIQPVA
jgi:uncharacterized membrane-anchored protein